jgi:hypothetical protein
MSFNDLIKSDLARIVSTTTGEFAETVSRWPDGDEDDSEYVNVVFLEFDQTRSTEAGVNVRRVGLLHVHADDLVPTVKDVWIIRNKTWNVLEVTEELAGEYQVTLTRVEKQKIFPQQGNTFL